MPDITVVCVLKSGRFSQSAGKEPYTPADVERLMNMVAKNLGDHRFVCFSDVDVPCERIPLKHGWPGWWSKIELFSWVFDGPVLYFDLDTVICGDLTELAEYPHKFTMLKDLGKRDTPASGMMAWNGDYSHIYLTFKSDPSFYMTMYSGSLNLGDQAFIAKNQKPDCLWQQIFPNRIFSYKFHLLGKPKPDEAKVVCFHGEPKGSGSSGWVRDIWSNANGSR